MPPRPPPERGFTLLELAVVAAILGMVLLLGARRLDVLTPDRVLDAEARRLKAVLEQARSAVALRGSAAEIVYDLDAGSYRLEFPGEGGPEVLLEGAFPEQVRFKRILRQDPPETSAGVLRLPLTASGGCPPHAVELVNEPEGAAFRALRVDPVLPFVEVLASQTPYATLFESMEDDRP